MSSAEPSRPNGWQPTPLQRTMFHRCLERPHAGLYLHQHIWRAPNQIDLEHARQAWACVADRHHALRAYFRLGEGREPRLFFETNVVVSARPFARLYNEVALETFLAADRAQGFDFATPPLWRITILRNDVSDIVVWTYHHILIDGPSRAAVFDEWRFALSAIVAGKAPEFTPIRPPYFADHLSALEVADTGGARALWREQLSGFSGGTPLPPWPVGLRRAATALPAFVETQIENVELLSNQARLHGATLNAVVQGAWALALARYNDIEDVTFGTTRAGRHLQGQDRATGIGMFITTVPFRVDVTDSQTVGSWLKRLTQQQVALRVGEFASPAQIRLWANLSPEQPLFRTVLVFTQEESGEAARAKGELCDVTKSEGVTLAAYAGRDLRLLLEYPSDEYDAVQIRTVLARVRTLILALTQSASDRTLATIGVKGPDELDALTSDRAAAIRVDFPREQSVVDFFRRVARQRPNAPAIRHGAREIPYGELERRSDQLAALLLRSGLQLEEPVALALDRSIEFAVAALGVLKAGGSYLPLDPHAPPRRMAQIIGQSGARWALTVADFHPQLAEWAGKVIEVDARALDELLAEHSSSAALGVPVASNPDRRAYLICTSGSTGAPKIVEIEHHSLTNLVCHHQRYLALTTSDRASWLSAPAFDASVSDLWPSLCSGGTVVIPEEKYAADPDGLISWIAQESVTVAFVPTPLAELLLRRPWPRQLALRFLSTGGDVLHGRPASGFPFVVLNTYGPTENTVDAIWAVVNPSGSDRPPIGRPIANVTAHVLDEEKRLLPPGEVGELYLGGEQVARGYLDEPRLTRECFVPDPFAASGGRMYRTGDLVRWTDKGELEFLGRIDLQVQIGGCRVELEEIESVLSRHPNVVEACCSPIKDGIVTRSIVAHIATSSASPELAGSLRDFLHAELPAYMVPSKFIFHTTLPHSHAGKLDRVALAARTPRTAPSRCLPSTAPFGNELRALWRELLPAAEEDETDKSFWESGGDSLKLIQLSLGVEEIMGQQLSLLAFLREPTLRGLLSAVEECITNDDRAGSERRQRTLLGKGPNDKTPVAVVQLQEGTGELPVYFISPEPALVRLAQMIGVDHSIFGIGGMSWRDATTDPEAAASPTVEQLVAPFVAALKSHVQYSPCVLVGHSFAGLMAFETARQLNNLGGKVEMVMLLDTWLKRPPPLYLDWAELRYRWEQTRNQAQVERSTHLIVSHLRSARFIFRLILVGVIKRIFRFFRRGILVPVNNPRVLLEEELVARMCFTAEKSFHPRVLDCRGVLFRASPSGREELHRAYDDSLGWKDLFARGLEIVSVPGDHLSTIREDPYRLTLASKMTEVLRRYSISEGVPSL